MLHSLPAAQFSLSARLCASSATDQEQALLLGCSATPGKNTKTFWAFKYENRGPVIKKRINTILYYTILYYTMLCYAMLCYAMLYYTILYYTILYYTILYYTILYYTMLYNYATEQPGLCLVQLMVDLSQRPQTPGDRWPRQVFLEWGTVTVLQSGPRLCMNMCVYYYIHLDICNNIGERNLLVNFDACFPNVWSCGLG